MRIRAGAATDIGLVREGNEDAYLSEEPLFAVADGMGGHRGGEVASRIAIDTLEAMFRRGEGGLSEQVQEANRAVFERSVLDRSVAGMGTTLTAAMIEGARARLAHVGDSRAYLLRDGELRLLTEDHTLVQRMVQQGEITPEEAERHPQRSVITRVLGVEPSVPVDEVVIDLRAGDRLLVCSDGLTSMLGDDEIAGLLRAEPDPQRAADALIRAANDAGGVDNTTVIVIDVDADDGSGETGDATARAGTRHDTAVRPASDATATTHVGASGVPGRLRAGRVIPWSRIATIGGIVVGVAVVTLIGLRAYLDSQWYVGVANGRVAILQGIPVEVAGFELHHVVVETTIPAVEAEHLALYRTLPDGITARDRADAEQIVEQIRRDVAEAARSATSPGTGGG